MCYSAQIEADYRVYLRLFGAQLSIRDFVDMFWTRSRGAKIKVPKGVELAFAQHAHGAHDVAEIRLAITEHSSRELTRLETELFEQITRLTEADRALAVKETKAALANKRIANDKIAQRKGWLEDLRRQTHEERDARIFPLSYAPVMVMEGGQRVIKPMRYQCRPAGKPVFYDVKYPGTYNARRDNLEGFWKGQFGHTHGVMIVKTFFENVPKHRVEGRELREGEKPENVRLQFKPRPAHDMLVACLWSHWSAPGEPELLSFAAITDEPPPEVAAAGHDRCIVPIKAEHVEAWLNPKPNNLAAQYAILDDRARPYYEHRLAA